MRISAAPDISQLLRTLPDMQPPPDAWRKIRARQRRGLPAAWAGLAVAACIALFAVALVTREEAPVAPVEPMLVENRQATPAHTGKVQRRVVSIDELRRRSQHMERVLQGLPRNPGIVQVDVAGAVGDLQDRIAVVDYELARSARRAGAQERSVIARWPADPSAAFRPASRDNTAVSFDLWQQRVDLMDRLVRARYMETGVQAR